MDMNSPIIMNPRFRGFILLVYHVLFVLVYTTSTNKTSLIPIAVMMGIVITSGFIVNGSKWIIITIRYKFFMKQVINVTTIEITENCCICLDDMDKDTRVGELTCTHHFHEECIKQWYRNSQTCPLCRIELHGRVELV